MITIVHISDCLRSSDPNYTYIGRLNKQRQLPRSPLANPFSMKRESERGEVCDRFQAEVLAKALTRKTGPMYEALFALAGRECRGEEIRLACWCTSEENDKRPYKRCHGHSIRTALLEMVQRGEHPEVKRKTIPGLGHSFVNGQWVKNSELELVNNASS